METRQAYPSFTEIELRRDSSLRLGNVDVREQQVPELGILKVAGHTLRFRHLLAGFPIRFKVAPNRFTSSLIFFTVSTALPTGTSF